MKRVNLVPHDSRARDLPSRIRQMFAQGGIYKVGFIVLVLCGVFFLWGGSSIARHRLAISFSQRAIRKAEGQLAQKQAEFETLQSKHRAVEKEREGIDRRLSLLQQVKRAGPEWSEILTQVSETVPQELFVTALAMDAEALSIQGVADDNDIIARFMKQLDDSSYFTETGFNYTRKADAAVGAKTEFEILTHLEKKPRR
jgi:Tfp pilus assembly protein PilN